MDGKATAVACAERQAVAEPHRPFRGQSRQEDHVVILAPCNELVAHEFCLLDPEFVLPLEFQPFFDRSLNGHLFADGFTFQQGFEGSPKPLHIRLRFRPNAGLGRPLVLSTTKLIPAQSCFGLSPVELKPE